jgi:hypothetical protein
MQSVSARETARIACSEAHSGAMIRWIVVVFLALVLINGLAPWLQRIGFGRLPGDLKFRWLGREWFIPLMSTLVLSAVASLIAKII